jgi:hypothetical protein
LPDQQITGEDNQTIASEEYFPPQDGVSIEPLSVPASLQFAY